MPMRYIVTCKYCGAKTGTNPPGMDPAGQEPTNTINCVQCNFPVSRKGGQYVKSRNQQPEKEFDLLSVE